VGLRAKRGVESRFQRLFTMRSESWGDAPGSYHAAPSALNSTRLEAPFDYAANELRAFAGEKGVRVVPTPVLSTQANNAQRSTLNAQCLNGSGAI
jgi:hypothetical protein